MKESEEYVEVIDVDYEKEEDLTHEIALVEDPIIGEEIPQEEVVSESIPGTDNRTTDTSFAAYDREKSKVEKEKRHGFFSRVTRFIGKIMRTLITIPVAIVGGGISLGVVVMGYAVGIGAIGAGILGLGVSAFLLTGYPGLIGILGMFIAMGLVAGGGLAICIVILIWRQIKRVIKWMTRYKVRCREVE